MKIVFIVLAVGCVLPGGYMGALVIAGVPDVWPYATSLIAGALLSAFAASVLHGFDRQIAATKELHAAIVASATGEEPSLPTAGATEIPEEILREKQKDDMAGRTLFKPKL
ncbi:hypothetical protein N9L14_01075 [Alphaproteobacteria bacterium]|nr:hypothetical protein [Alphaproteobacteria bacterium]